MSNACNAHHQTHNHRDGLGRRTNACANSFDESGSGCIRWSTAPHKIRVQRRIRQLENPLEARDFVVAEIARRRIEKRGQHGIELPHPPPAPPPQSRKSSGHVRAASRVPRGVALAFGVFTHHRHSSLAPPSSAAPGTPYNRRSAIIFLISAIALPGFKSFGQACVQFKIV